MIQDEDKTLRGIQILTAEEASRSSFPGQDDVWQEGMQSICSKEAMLQLIV